MSLSQIVVCEYCGEPFTDKGLTRHQQYKHPSQTPTSYKADAVEAKRIEAERRAWNRRSASIGIDGDRW